MQTLTGFTKVSGELLGEAAGVRLGNRSPKTATDRVAAAQNDMVLISAVADSPAALAFPIF